MNLEGFPYVVAPMTIHDIPTVSAIEQVVFSLPWSSTAYRYEITQNAASQYVVLRYGPWVRQEVSISLLRPVRRLVRSSKEDLSLVAYGGHWLIFDEAHICTVAVRPEWRGRGLGELLLVALIEKALDSGAQVLTLEARVSNIVAQNLYAKYGFEVKGRRRRYYSDNGEDAFIMSTPSVVASDYRHHFDRLQRLWRESHLTRIAPPPTIPSRDREERK